MATNRNKNCDRNEPVHELLYFLYFLSVHMHGYAHFHRSHTKWNTDVDEILDQNLDQNIRCSYTKRRDVDERSDQSS